MTTIIRTRMNNFTDMNREEILKKIADKVALTEEEELFYLVEIIGYEEDEALAIIEINKNTDKNILID